MKRYLVISLALITGFAASAPEKKPASPMSDSPKTYSIALRVRRVTYEDAYVAVPVTDAIMKKNEDGSSGIDFEKFLAEGIRISQDSRVEWRVEDAKTTPHEIQQAPPVGRKSFDAYTDQK